MTKSESTPTKFSYYRDGSVISSFKEEIIVSVISLDSLKSFDEPNTLLMYLLLIGMPGTLVLLIGEIKVLNCFMDV